jgi:hypothetical protein
MNVLYINIDLAGSSTSFQYARFINSENKRSVGRLRARVCVKSNDIYPHIIPSLLFGKKGHMSTHYLTLCSVTSLWLICPGAVNIYTSTGSVKVSTRNVEVSHHISFLHDPPHTLQPLTDTLRP